MNTGTIITYLAAVGGVIALIYAVILTTSYLSSSETAVLT